MFLLKRVMVRHTFGVQEACHSQVSFSHTEGLFKVLQVGLSVHFTHVEESGTSENKNKKSTDNLQSLVDREKIMIRSEKITTTLCYVYGRDLAVFGHFSTLMRMS